MRQHVCICSCNLDSLQTTIPVRDLHFEPKSGGFMTIGWSGGGGLSPETVCFASLREELQIVWR